MMAYVLCTESLCLTSESSIQDVPQWWEFWLNSHDSDARKTEMKEKGKTKTKSKKVDYVQQETKSLQSLRQLCKSQFYPDFCCPGVKFWMIFACNCHHASIFSLQATGEWKLSDQERWKLQPNSLNWDTKLTPCW